MPSIHRLENATLYVYAGDHAPPHFHVEGPNSSAQIRIDNLQVLRGEITRSDYAQALAWASVDENYERLCKMWSDLNERD